MIGKFSYFAVSYEQVQALVSEHEPVAFHRFRPRLVRSH